MQRFREDRPGRTLDVLLLVFTQTGITLRVAESMAEALGRDGHDCTILPTPLFAPAEVELGGVGLIGVGTPSLYCRAPAHIKRYVSHLPDLRGRRAFAFVTSFGASGRALAEVGGALRNQGAEVLGGSVVRGEMRARVPALSGRAAGRPAEADLRGAIRLARSAAEHAVERRPGVLPVGLSDGRLLSREDVHGVGHGFYDLAGLLLRDPVVRLLLPEPEVAAHLCNRCRWCVENCPVHAITFAQRYRRQIRVKGNGGMTDVPHVGPGCTRCYRCLDCPVGAVSVDWAGRDRGLSLIYHPLLVKLFGDTVPGELV